MFATILFTGVHAQDSTKNIQSILNGKRYSFVPQTMLPMRGRSRQITDASYALDVRGDSLVVYLPYIGEAYSAPYGSGDNGYNFTSTNYDYSVKQGRKNRYEVTIRVKDKMAGSTFNLTVFDNKSASLQASSNDRQGISYNGYIKTKK